MATEQCSVYQFKSPFYPGESCEDVYNKNLESRDKAGYYWITDGPTRVYCGMTYTGSSCEDIYSNNPEIGDKAGYYRINGAQWTYCNMTMTTPMSTCYAGASTGGWIRVASFNRSAGDSCPSGWIGDTIQGVSFCRINDISPGSCSSTLFSANGISYQKVCGRARGYQKGPTYGFYASTVGRDINQYYVDGLSITYGSPRQHIWTYAMGRTDNDTNSLNCPCAPYPGPVSPSYVGSHYYCESGVNNNPQFEFYSDDPLWDGSDCFSGNCCNIPNLPWFYRELDETTTNDIEARLCAWDFYSHASAVVDQLEIFIQ